ncbi:MAG: undecaprenyldiphospho-muramoylpentapeptide beta-N-acetylglucosaminyltransferase [Nitrospinae bacterium]|nr:undecaprenyldiphospho-muramoylpentapeptide beta-N-acetylglucosaminyltransferase [Nitrospinota bacterium]
MIVTAGGTGGHIYPALAVADELKRMGNTILFVGGQAGPEHEMARSAGFDFLGIDVRGFDRRHIGKMARALFTFPMALGTAAKAVNVFQPDAVIGAGGYASGPSCLAASMKGVPLFLMEQNVYPGLVTRWLAGKARRVYANFAESARWLRGADVMAAGNPTRREFSMAVTRDFDAPRKTILVMGGSQGANAVNRAVMGALPRLAKMNVKIYHQTGKQMLAETRAAYLEAMVEAVVEPYFENMAAIMRESHLAVARAGAGTCAELALTALPGILIPYPGAGGHQRLNALAMENVGAAAVVDEMNLTGELLAETVYGILRNPDKLGKMSANARENAKPDAARVIARDIVKQLEAA